MITDDEYLERVDKFNSQPHYAQLVEQVFLTIRKAQVGGKKDLRILDYGSGAGYLLNKIRSAFEFSIQGYEPNEKLWATSINRYPGMHVWGKDVDLSKKEPFDVITCTYVLGHVDDPRKELTQINKLLIPGGQFVLAVPNKWHDLSCRFTKNLFTGYEGDPTLKNIWFPGTVEHMLDQHEFDFVREFRYGEKYLGAFPFILLVTTK